MGFFQKIGNAISRFMYGRNGLDQLSMAMVAVELVVYVISMFIGGKKVYFEAGTPDSPVTSADFDIPENAPYVRFSVYDFNGRFADTRGFFRDELGI